MRAVANVTLRNNLIILNFLFYQVAAEIAAKGYLVRASEESANDFNTFNIIGIGICGCSLWLERSDRTRNGSGSQTKERDLFHTTQSLETSSCAFPPASRISNESDLRS